MNEPQYKPITGMINVNDIQEIIENNRYYQEEIERLNNIIKEVREEIRILETNCDIADYQAQKLFQILDKENNND